MANCVDKILAKIPDANREEVSRIVEQMTDIKRKNAFLEGMSNPDSVYREKAMNMLNQYRNAALKARVSTLQNIEKVKALKEFVELPIWADAIKGSPTFTNPHAKATEALLTGTNLKGIANSKRSIGARKDTYINTLGSGFFRQIDLNQDLKIIQSGSLNKEIFISTWDISHKKTSTISGTAQRIGNAIANLDKAILAKLKESGAWIEDLDGHTFLQSHDSELIKAASFEKWKQDILPLLDDNKTFDGDLLPVEDPNAYLLSIYEGITDNKPKSFQDDTADQLVKIIGMPSNVAKRLGQQRKLHFKDGEALFKYNEMYGTKDLGGYIYSKISSTARSAAMMEVLGTNPRATLERAMSSMSKVEQNWINNLWSELDGSTSIPGKSTKAVVGASIRATTNMAKLGGVIFSQLPDTMTRAANLWATNGQGLMQSLGNTFFDGMKNMTPSNQREVARLLGVGIDTMLGQVHDRFGSMDWKPGAVSKANDMFMKLNLMAPWTNGNRAGHAQTLSDWLGANASKEFASLPQGKNLHRYGIGPAEWDVMRASASEGMIDLDGVEQVSPDVVKGIMEKSGMFYEGITEASKKRMVMLFQSRTRDKLATYFSEEVKTAMNEPGAYERAIFNRGTSQDEVMGQVARMMAQFKTFPVTVLTKTVNDLAMAEGIANLQQATRAFFTGGANFQGLAALMAGTTIMAAISESLRAVATGKTPPDYSKPDVWRNAMMRGGALGIYGDFLLGEFDSRYGRNAMSTIAGPVLGQFNDIMDLKTKLMDGDPKTNVKARDALRLILNNTPGANLFYLRTAADYTFLYASQEHLNPGFVARTKERLRKDGQRFIIEPNR